MLAHRAILGPRCRDHGPVPSLRPPLEMQVPVSASFASLVARDLTKSYGPASCSTGSRAPSGPNTGSAWSHPTAPGSPRCCGSSPVSTHPTPARSPARRRARRWATSAGAGTARGRDGATSRGARVVAAADEQLTTRRPPWPNKDPEPTTPTRTPSSSISHSARPTSTPGSAPCARISVCTSACSTSTCRRSPRAGGPCEPRRDRARPLRRVPARRAHERPRLQGPRTPGTVPVRRARRRRARRVARPRVPRPHDHVVLELDEHSHSATEYAGGWQSYLDEQATARRHAEEEYATYRAQRGELVDRAQRQRQWSVQGKARLAKSGENDKHVREFRRNSSEHVAAKAKISDRALARLEATRSTSRGRAGTSAWRSRPRPAAGRSSPGSRARWCTAATSPSAPSISTSSTASALRSSARTEAARRRCSTPYRSPSRSTRANGGSGRASSWASSTRRAVPSPAPRRCSPGSRPRAGCPRARPIAPREVRARRGARRPPRRFVVPGRTTRASLALLGGAGRQLPRARRADEPPRPPGDRAARVGAGELHGHAVARHARPRAARPRSR